MRKEKWTRCIWIVLLILWMGVIFYFSSQTGEESSEMSGGITLQVIHWIWRDFDVWTAARQEALLSQITFLVRKCAHFTEYAILGFLASGTLSAGRKKRKVYLPAAWCFATVYAVTDELHQMFSDGRSPQIFDVMVDSAGALFGAAGFFIVLIVLQRGRKLIYDSMGKKY